MIGLLPAGGTASRLYGLPKFLLPVDGTYLLAWHAAQHRAAGVDTSTVFGCRATMPFIMPYLAPGMQVISREAPTVAAAIRNGDITNAALFTMPDTFWTDRSLLPRLTATVRDGAEVAVGLWGVRDDQRGQLGQCKVNDNDLVVHIVDKQSTCPYPWIWGALAWSPTFWRFIQAEDTHLGLSLQRAIYAGVRVRAVFADGYYHDCGTWAGYARLCRELTEESIYA